ncbi:DNA-directed DNA polymerase [Chytriomyces confervae]|uniref:DNA-directed DNA polymerase n=1 Tax=Chytriomyces confervae TaxID=246404 RepID=A0A507D6Y1_9FUNG|nr:DNA-directed DNA polymerase [Chytriomyces confervae]
MQAKQNTPKFKGECNNCNKKGHKKVDCWSKGGDKEGQGPRQKEKKNDEQKANQVNQTKNYVLTASKIKSADGDWILDSGASNHMTGDKAIIRDLKPQDDLGKVTVASGDQFEITGVGSIELMGEEGMVTITGVLYVPDLSVNLLSISALSMKGATVNFNGNGVSVSIEEKVILRANDICEGLYTLKDDKAGLTSKVTATRETTMGEAHRFMGHLNAGDLQKLMEQTDGLEIKDTELGDCSMCMESKTTRKVGKEKSVQVQNPGEELNLDLTFINGTLILMVSDTGSGCTFAKILEKKSDALQGILDIIKLIETQYNHKLKTIVSDGGGKFINKKFTRWCEANGVKHEVSTPYTPEQNGIAERKNRTIVEMCRTMLADAKMDKEKYWTYAFEMAVYIRNQCPTRATTGSKTPYEALTGKRPNLKYMRRFGEPCVAYIDSHKRKKLDNKGVQCRVLGIEEKGYLLVEVHSRRTFKSIHVKFPREEVEPKPSSDELPELLSDSEDEDDEPEQRHDEPVETRNVWRRVDARSPEPITVTEAQQQWEAQLQAQQQAQPRAARSKVPVPEQTQRVIEPRDKIAAKDINSSVDQSNIIEEGRRRRATYAFSALTEDPKSITEALERSDSAKWKDAILDELNSLVENGTWEVIDLRKEPTENIADTKWVHKRKQDAAGVFEKYKSRLVVQGFTQVEGVDYDETFVPVVRSTTIKVLISVSLAKEYRITQMDVVTAYLNSKMDFNVVIRIPDGYELLDPEIDQKRHALRLLKGLYRTKQGGYLWNEEFKGTLVSMGFKQSVLDPGLFRIQRNGSELLITLYVDDILIAMDNEDLRKWVEDQLAKKYKVKFMGEIHTLLRSVISVKNGCASFQQSNYLESIGRRYGLENTKHRTPMEAGVKLPEGVADSVMEQYRSLLGAVMYASVSTRPDVAYATAYLGRFASKATEPHWTALKRLARYLVNTKELELKYVTGKANLIEAWVDASHLSEGAYGVSGHAVFVGGNLVCWRSRKQRTVALSSMEAEVNALVDVVKEVLWLKELLTDMGVSGIKTVIFEDNQATIASSKNAIVKDQT